jgi:hypothetical protein
MTKKHRLSYLFICLACFTVVGALSACKRTTVPTDTEISKAFMDNKKSFGDLMTALTAEGNLKYIIGRSGSVSYQGSNQPAVSGKTIELAQQIMRRTACVGAQRDGDIAKFIFFEDNSGEYFRCKSLLYDPKEFIQPVLAPAPVTDPNSRATEIEPHWRVEYKFLSKTQKTGK